MFEFSEKRFARNDSRREGEIHSIVIPVDPSLVSICQYLHTHYYSARSSSNIERIHRLFFLLSKPHLVFNFLILLRFIAIFSLSLLAYNFLLCLFYEVIAKEFQNSIHSFFLLSQSHSETSTQKTFSLFSLCPPQPIDIVVVVSQIRHPSILPLNAQQIYIAIYSNLSPTSSSSSSSTPATT